MASRHRSRVGGLFVAGTTTLTRRRGGSLPSWRSSLGIGELLRRSVGRFAAPDGTARPTIPLVPDARDRRRGPRGAEARQAPRVLDRAQQAVVARRLRVGAAGANEWAERERGDAAAAANVGRALVEDDKDDAAREQRAPEDGDE